MNKTQKHVLVVEDEKVLQGQIKSFLKDRDYSVSVCSSAREAIDFCIKNVIDLVILDLTLPDKDGMVVIESVRSFNNVVPIIVLSSRDNIETKVTAFETGCNDYLVKPFDFLELAVRSANQLRYYAKEEKHVLINGPLMIDFDAMSAYVNGIEIHFTNLEYKIIILLANNINRTLTHEYIISHIWGNNGQDQNGLRVFMAGIRKKISKDERSSKLIRTDIGLGYRMNTIK